MLDSDVHDDSADVDGPSSDEDEIPYCIKLRMFCI